MSFRWASVLLGLAGCAGEEVNPADVTWHEDIQPMLDQHCTRCHTEGGQGVGDFTNLEEVRLLSGVMLDRMESGEMPPPVADPECRDYSGSEFLSVSDDSIDLFSEWIAEDMAEGEKGASPASTGAEFLQSLDGANLTVMMPTPYVPSYSDPTEPGNEYRCFALEHGQEENFYITGMAPLVGEESIVHHIVLFKQPKSELRADYDPAVGYDCMDSFSLFEGMLGGWAPGATPIEFAPDHGFLVTPNDHLVVQLHYYNAGTTDESVPDQTGYEFRTVKNVGTPLTLLPLGGYDFRIPAGDEAFTEAYSQYIPESYEYEGLDIPIPGLTLHGVFPHMHVLGTGYDMWVERADGSEECAVRSDTYDFYNQLTYMFNEPLDVDPGDTVHWSCTWNNSESNPNLIYNPPKAVKFGERTDEEMCFMFSIISTRY